MSFPQNRQFASIRSHEPVAPIWQAEAVRAGPYIFTSARMATDWKSGIPAEAGTNECFPYFGSDAELQTDYVLRSLSRTLESAGSNLELVFKAHVFLLDGADFLGFDRVWNRYFKRPPTRTTVGAAGLLVPGARLEIAFIALANDSGLRVEPAVSDAPRPLTKKVEAVRAGDFVFTSGQLAHNAVDGVPPEAQGPQGQADMGRQTAYTLANMTRSLAAAGARCADVVKGQALLLDTRQEAEFLPTWREAFDASAQLPALAVPGIGSLLVTGTLIEIDLTAYTGGPVRLPTQIGARGPDAIGCGDLVFSAGIFPGFDNGALPPECAVHPAYPHYSSAIKLQTEWVLARLDAALRAVGSDLKHIAKAQVFLTDLNDFTMFDEVWRAHFPTPPARSVVQTSGFAVPGAKVAIEVIALSA